ncbi:MAG: radical SAM protein [Desulfobacterales bacterium]|nr:radical SAM protein [Desulfobacterales bacterium]MCP4161845.1 radical SAM protein [Deltaproteobacteria bacterium]
MMEVKNVNGINRFLFNIKIRSIVFFLFIKQVFTGKLSPFKLIPVLRRLEFFLGKLKENKFVSIDGKIRTGLYVPGLPSKPFETACNKFTVFGEKLPNTTVLISITSACSFNCTHCYQKNDIGKDVDLERLLSSVKKIQDSGVAFFNIEGGEPFIAYDRLKSICTEIDDRSEIWVNSTGHGMTIERLKELKNLGLTAVMFPLHNHKPAVMNSFMGSDKAWETISNGVDLCHKAGIAVSFNMCLSRDDFFNETFEECMGIANEKKAAIIQIIKPKSAGAWLEEGASEFSNNDLSQIREKVMNYNHNKEYADYPSISAQFMEEDPNMFGCTAGGTDRFYINAKGDVQPCEFLNVSFGNIAEEDFDLIYKRMREVFRTPKECWLCEKYSGDICDIYKTKNLKSLPLSPELTEKLINNFDWGENTKLYEKIEKKIV